MNKFEVGEFIKGFTFRKGISLTWLSFRLHSFDYRLQILGWSTQDEQHRGDGKHGGLHDDRSRWVDEVADEKWRRVNSITFGM